eukprot:scaffold40.g5165.t1
MRQSNKRSAGRKDAAQAPDPKRQKASILRYLQKVEGPRGQVNHNASSSRESSEEPGLPSHTPAFPVVPGMQRGGATGLLPTFPTGGAKVQTGLLQSLQRRFVQQALATPAAVGAPATKPSQQAGPPEEGEMEEEEEEEDLGGFVLHSQPAYERTLSQRCYADDGGAPPDLPATGSAEDTQSHFDLAAAGGGEPTQDAWAARERRGAGPRLQQEQAGPAGPGGGGGPVDPEELRRRLSNASNASHRTTPGLPAEERVAAAACAGLGSASRLFPIFRSRRDMKQLFLIRHGESEYNAESAKCSAQGGGWADPWIFDAPLTERGRAQAAALRGQLAALGLPADTLWVTSPLQRAIQTLLLCCPVAHLLPPVGAAAAAGASCSSEDAAPDSGSRDGAACSSGSGPGSGDGASSSGARPPVVCVRHEISERVCTTGDIGHPASQLRQLFPQLTGELAALPEVWWHTREDKVNCSLRKRFELHEPKSHVLSRIGDFRKWLLARPEKVVVAVGHSCYWNALWMQLTGSKPDRMRNCELLGPIWV